MRKEVTGHPLMSHPSQVVPSLRDSRVPDRAGPVPEE
jgi:hypothetical protein